MGKTATRLLLWDCWVTAKVVKLNLIKGPVAHLLVRHVSTQCMEGRHGAALPVGYFPSASRKYCVKKMPLEMVVGKHRGESAVKINFYFLNTHALQSSASMKVQILVLCCWLGCCQSAPGRLAKRRLCGCKVGKLREHPVLAAALTHAAQVGCRLCP